MHWRAAFWVAVICLTGQAWVLAQPQSPTPSSSSTPAPVAAHDPEDAFLSPTSYTNAYFGFEFDLPPDAKLKPIAMPAAADRRIQLLEMVGGTPEHAAISVSAYEYKNKNYTDAKGILRRQLDQQLFVGVEELHGISKTNIDGRQFYYFECRHGVEQHMELAAEANGYILFVILKANDPGMVKGLASAFYHLKFFPPGEAQRHAGPGSIAYQGPAISSQHLREVKADAPADHMDPGKIEGNTYRNSQIGMRYEFPKGWNIEPQGAIEPAVLRYREKVTGEPILGPRERAVVKACRRTLISLWRTKPDSDGQVPYDDFGEVTLSAMPLSCFPNLQFPDDPKDAGAVRRFIVGLSFTEPLQHDMSDARTYEAGGKGFVLTHGTIAYKEEGDELSRRISVATAFTQQRGYLLIWLFAAPHDTELRELLSAKIGFDTDPAGKEAPVNRSVGGSAAPDNPQSPSSPAANASPAADQPGTVAPSDAGAPASGAAPTDSNSAVQAPASSSQAYAPPSLLRDGEDTQSQQMQGQPIPNKRPH